MSEPSSPRPARGRPPRLDQARTVETALTLLNDSGLDALTMRRLAEAMGVQAGALYRYFATKGDLLTAMAERMVVGVCAPADGVGGADWSDRLAGLARALRRALLAHRDSARVFAGTHSTGPNTLGFADAGIGVLRDAGFTDADAARALMAMVHFTVGHTLEEQAALRPGDGSPADPDVLREAVASDGYPHLTAALPTLTEPDYEPHFEFGLALLVAGLRALRRPHHR
ncbi:TetR/AcrR family transcriptional regulator [Streptomyces sp. NBC_00091]|uniref:TetR/AcrR family transcriptional regulator n=1 Tax=Streptomyces sp. NBC_00091 TaxID=2975648 RepID=UPI002255DF3D|nr:TetR/AcrR family transcriptional regulator [Streptomyces sp. NBC_00091]MCX5381618.1 TetR/AcrR family transcriptional regulator [Streptomyces sp. NBC_00091]